MQGAGSFHRFTESAGAPVSFPLRRRLQFLHDLIDRERRRVLPRWELLVGVQIGRGLRHGRKVFRFRRWLDEEDGVALHKALTESEEDMKAGRLVDAEVILRELRSTAPVC